MGKPVRKSWFGQPVGVDTGHITVDGVKFADGTTSSNAYIVKQTGSAAYIVQDDALTHDPEIVFMVNATSTGALQPGECYIKALPFGGVSAPCAKIAQYRVDLYEGSDVNSYSWSTTPAVDYGQADLIKTSAIVPILAPVISGTPAVGQALTVSTGSWSGVGPFTYAYAWSRDGTPIGGAVTNSHTAVVADYGTMLTVNVTATDALLATGTIATAGVGPVTAVPPSNTVLPAITGLLTNGSVLTVSNGTWTGTATITYTYKWFKDGTEIPLAVANTYTSVLGDVGSMISAEVTGTNVAGVETAAATEVGPIS